MESQTGETQGARPTKPLCKGEGTKETGGKNRSKKKALHEEKTTVLIKNDEGKGKA